MISCVMVDVRAFSVRRPPVSLIGRNSELAWCANAFSRRRVLVICGLAGIGKTSLVLAAAHDQARRLEGAVAYHACGDGEPIGSVLTSLLAGRLPSAKRLSSLRAALDAIVAWARSTPLVLCIDDAHRVSDPLLIDVLAHLGAAAAPVWLVVASRRQLLLPDVDIGGTILRLGPLSEEGARALWDDLEDRFGPPITRFETLDAARRGSPFALRRAFATGLTKDDYGVNLTDLAPEQAALLAQICAFGCPVDASRLAERIPERMTALPGLLQALLVEVTHTRSLVVHDLVRASVDRSSRPPTPADHVVCLAYYEAGDNDPLARLRHTVGAERWSAAVDLIDSIVRPQYGLLPMGAAAETQLLAAFAALERAHVALPLPLRLTRLQLAARHGQGRAVLETLRGEASDEPAAWPHLATVELVLGDSDAAEKHIRQALADPTIVAGGPLARAFLIALLLEVLRRQGRVDALDDVLVDFKAIAAQLGPIGAGVAEVILAAISYDQEDYEDAARRLASVRTQISLLGFAPTLQATHALLERAARAALLSPPDDARSATPFARALLEEVDFLRATLLLFAADGDMFEGNIVDAEARARDAEAIAARSGYRGIQQWALYTRAECLRMRGHAAAAVELAEQALADPLTAVHRRQRLLFLTVSALGLAQLGRTCEARGKVGSSDELVHAPSKAARLSVLPWITPAEVKSDLGRAEFALAQQELALVAGHLEEAQRWSEAASIVRRSRWQYLRARLAVHDAELAVRIADVARAEVALGEAEALCTARGYRREHATVALISVACALLVADPARATYWAEVAVQRAEGISRDIEAAAARVLRVPAEDARSRVSTDNTRGGGPWLERLELAEPRAFRLRDPTGVRHLTQRQADAVRFAEPSFGVDILRRVVRIGGAVHSLAKRPGLWSVLLAFVKEPGCTVSPDDLARDAWGVGYHAVRHRSRLVVSIKRLRDTLGVDVITAVAGGYRLSVCRWAVLEPIE